MRGLIPLAIHFLSPSGYTLNGGEVQTSKGLRLSQYIKTAQLLFRKGIYETMTYDEKKEEKVNRNLCDECQSPNIQWGGSCPLCMDCGWSKCQ